ncbi:hypothetical protein [Mycobacteroides abscessus]|uniref:hypothetical protein n=1 Tax=Mycobacteroides abscessus TaxID=36809 RepID=UPI0018A67612|nr:hypothetical protein [Mycobacteroides abscessus]QOF29671.1 hypothetical protein E3G43_003231 [Mycobacteroides abscessus]
MSDIDWETVEVDDGFRAAHHGVCGKCGEDIFPGERIRRAVGGHYEHVKCDIDVDAEADAALKDQAPTNGDHNPARAGDCAKPCGAPGCASWGCLS